MKMIFRYVLPVNDNIHTLTLSGEIVHVASRKSGQVEVWALHGDGVPATRRFRIVGTGHRLPDEAIRHVGTALDGPFVWHLVELPTSELAS
jgi:hypothetical protein